MTTVLSDLALARRLEMAEGRGNAAYVDAKARLDPASGALWKDIGGTYAMFAGVGSPITQTFGLGLHQPLADKDLDAIERFRAQSADARSERLRARHDARLARHETAPLGVSAAALQRYEEAVFRVTQDGRIEPANPVATEFAARLSAEDILRLSTAASKSTAADRALVDLVDVGRGDKWERVETPERFDYLKEPKSPIRLFPHRGVIQDFIDSIREQRDPTVGGAEGRAAVEICEACLISARTGKAVDLPLSGGGGSGGGGGASGSW